MNFKKMFKRESKVMAYIVICLTIVVLGASYALFFQVKDNTKHQYVNAGSLVIEYDYGNTVDVSKNNCLTPQSSDTAKTGGCTFKLSIYNSGSLPMQYDLLIYKAAISNSEVEDSSSIGYVDNGLINFSLKKEYTSEDNKMEEFDAKTIGSLDDYKDTDDEGNEITKKIIETSTIDAGKTIVFYLNIWLDEDVDTDIIGKYVSLALDVKGTVYENDDATDTLVSNMDVNGLSEIISDTEAVTADTDTLKEYRFTGSNPLNYVYYNCTDETTDSCEIWRILGIYNVDGISRMKIVKADYTETDKMTSVWNTNADNTDNSFDKSTLNEYLTSYYKNLSDTAKGQIEEAIYYLGGAASLEINSRTLYGSEKLSTYSTEVGIMSLSDYTLAIDTNSNTNISDLIITSDNNWLYKLENEWFINKNTSNEIYTTVPSNLVDGTAVITISTSADAGSEKLIRPVVYLASNIKILDADSTNENAYGSINNPYVLSK
jgi:hypothetical protein